ncbi:hypothetical protein [Paenibacillus sp. DYY-L-2]|uniref:hypothetical protein n=1 Tax=Paenibacillus sp. DYY-L-2 TaxID=3447013 RepID=UPI003F5019FF
MSKFLDVVGKITIVAAIILGIVYGVKSDPIAEALRIDDDAFRWTVAIAWWVSGIISGALLIAFGMMLNYLEENNSFLRELVRKSREMEAVAPKNENYENYAKEANRKFRESKPATSKLAGYKFKAND